jgi:cytochrome c peroxidase
MLIQLCRQSDPTPDARHLPTGAFAVVVGVLLTACGRAPPENVPVRTTAAASSPSPQAQSFYANDFQKTPAVADMTRLGRLMFYDPALSKSGKLACSTCYDPAFAYGPAPRSSSSRQAAGLDGVITDRAIPSLRYMQDIPPFSEHHFDESADESADQGPTGGHMWDGRADTLHDQAKLPLFSPREMANSSAEDVVAKVSGGPYAACVRQVFGDDVFADPQKGFKAILKSLEVFQQSPQEFYPYSSKFDAWLRNQTKLTLQESRGLEIFNDPRKGNCASCHPSQIRAGSFPQFTDFGYVAVGVPRNRAIATNADPNHFDMGLCGPVRSDLQDHPEYCGRFRAPTLRNVSLRHTFFHNAVMTDLRKVLEFYAQRDTHPERFYAGGGTVQKFDDLPAAYRGNVNLEPPFGGKPGGRPSLSKADISDLEAFLATLTDGYDVTRGYDTQKAQVQPVGISGSANRPPEAGCEIDRKSSGRDS